VSLIKVNPVTLVHLSIRLDKITMNIDSENFLDFGFDTFDLVSCLASQAVNQTHLPAGLGTMYERQLPYPPEIAHPFLVNDTDSMVDHSIRSKSLEASRAPHTIDESHLQSSSLEDAFDPFNYFDVGNAAGESSAHMDLDLDLGLDWDAGPQ